ncbi:hypothetical protein ACXC9Q_28940 [Kribbella sp. CWNU-51]
MPTTPKAKAVVAHRGEGRGHPEALAQHARLSPHPPAEPDRSVVLRLDDGDGANPDGITELESLDDPAAYVIGLSTRTRFFQFGHDFRRNAKVPFEYGVRGDGLVLRLADAMASSPARTMSTTG